MKKTLLFLLAVTAPAFAAAQDIEVFQAESVQPNGSQNIRWNNAQSVQQTRSQDIEAFEGQQVKHITEEELRRQSEMTKQAAQEKVKAWGPNVPIQDPGQAAAYWQQQTNHRVVEFGNDEVKYRENPALPYVNR